MKLQSRPCRPGANSGWVGWSNRALSIDGPAELEVQYVGILPDLFREGQGVIARGSLNEQGSFDANEVLAKHDENYMPPEVKDALEKTGHTVASE